MRSIFPSAFPTRHAKRATILIGVRDHLHHRSLMVQILQEARRAKLVGATVFEAQEGYGASGRIHQNHALNDDHPIAIVIVDLPDRIEAFLHDEADLLARAVVIVDEIEIVEH